MPPASPDSRSPALFVASILILRNQPSAGSTAAEIRDFYLGDTLARWRSSASFSCRSPASPSCGSSRRSRNLIGDLEDRFFATVFLGSGLLFVAMLFIAAGVGGALLAAVKFSDQPVPARRPS